MPLSVSTCGNLRLVGPNVVRTWRPHTRRRRKIKGKGTKRRYQSKGRGCAPSRQSFAGHRRTRRANPVLGAASWRRAIERGRRAARCRGKKRGAAVCCREGKGRGRGEVLGQETSLQATTDASQLSPPRRWRLLHRPRTGAFFFFSRLPCMKRLPPYATFFSRSLRTAPPLPFASAILRPAVIS